MIRLKRILVPTDFSDSARNALTYGISFAKEFEAELLLLHVVETIPVGYASDLFPVPMAEVFQELSGYAKAELAKLAAVAREKQVGVREMVTQGKPSAEIVRVAREETVDMIVLGTHGTGILDKFQMDLTGPQAPTPGSTVVATWAIRQPTASPYLVAPSAIPGTNHLVVDADVQVAATPLAVPSGTRSALATGAAASASAGQQLQPPNVLVTMTPTATGVIAVQPDAFTLYAEPPAGGGARAMLYDCTVATAAEASAAALLITVKPSVPGTGTGTGTGASTGTNTGLPTPALTPTPEPTITVTRTHTSQPRKQGQQIRETPGGGASTGGGGSAGPDARMIILGGSLMVAAAGIGGLLLRRRTSARS